MAIDQSGDENTHGLTDALHSAGEKISGAAGEALGDASDGARDWAQGKLGAAGDAVSGVTGGLAGIVGAAGGAFSGAGEAVSGAAEAVVGQGREWLHGAGESIGETIEGQSEQVAGGRLDFNESDRLPWLESDEDEEYQGVDTKKVIGAVVGGVALLGAIVGGLWNVTHHKDGAVPVADGSVIAAPSEAVKEAPKDPGGKQFAGTGDTSFAASQGKGQPPHMAGSDGAIHEGAKQVAAGAAEAAASTAAAAGASFAGGVAKPVTAAAKPAVAAATAVAETAGPAGGVVQIAAYSSEASAQTGWNRLVAGHDMLKGQNHRIVSAKIDMGTVYRLQLVTSAGGGAALCARLKADGLACQVKH